MTKQANVPSTPADQTDLEEKLKRALADYHNLLRRTTEEKSQIRQEANRQLMIDILPTLDTLGRAIDHQADPVLSMVLTELQKALTKHGLERIWTRNKPFDHNTMEAIGTDNGPKDIVIKEEQPGYELNGTVIRHAFVIVGNGQE